MSSGVTVGQLTITPKERKTLRNILEWLELEEIGDVRLYRTSEGDFEIYNKDGRIAKANNKVVIPTQVFS